MHKLLLHEQKALFQSFKYQNFKEFTNYTILGLKLRLINRDILSEYMNQFIQSEKTIQSYVVASRIMIVNGLEVLKLRQNIDSLRIDEILTPEISFAQLAALNFLINKLGLREEYVQKVKLFTSMKVQKEFTNYYTIKSWINNIRSLYNIIQNDRRLKARVIAQCMNGLKQYQNHEKIAKLVMMTLAMASDIDAFHKNSTDLKYITSISAKFTNKQILLILNSLIHFGVDQSYDIRQYVAQIDYQSLDVFQEVILLRAEQYFQKDLGLKSCKLIKQVTNSSKLSDFLDQSRNTTIQKESMIAQTIYTYKPFDIKDYQRKLFKQHKNPQESVDFDITQALVQLKIPFVRECIIGPYIVDFFIPDMNAQGAEIKFENFEDMEKFVNANTQGIILEINGRNHFIDDEMLYYKGGSLLKFKYFQDKIVTMDKKQTNTWYHSDPNRKLELLKSYLSKSKK